MSTEHQQYSIANQSAAIALYAAAHDLGVIRSFVDEGKSGTSINRRTGLQELIQLVESGTADFDHVLVYDISRWGRFPDSDEAAHYEFLCKRGGIAVHYCAEQFENDNSATSNLLKALKRTMAGEYSRELGVKVSVGQRRLAGMGFWQGGNPPFGFQRQLISQSGERKQILKDREWKSITTDRDVLTPGPQEAVDTIRLAFDLYTLGRKTRREIASILNEKKCLFNGRVWNRRMLRDLFTNPVYKGSYVYGKHTFINGKPVHHPPDKWQVIEHAFPGIVSDEQWKLATDRVVAERKPLVNSEMLDDLRRLWKREGKLTELLIEAAKDVPSTVAYRDHFGSLVEAYKAAGYPYTREYAYVNALRMMRKMRRKLCEEICERIRAVGGTAERQSYLAGNRAHGLLLVNGNITVRITSALVVRLSKLASASNLTFSGTLWQCLAKCSSWSAKLQSE
jgi:DNA invertase Pin-like site-specific DNA recombinase